MAMSNERCPPNFVYDPFFSSHPPKSGPKRANAALRTASMAIALAGERFTDRAEQAALMEILEKCENEHAWPTLIA